MQLQKKLGFGFILFGLAIILGMYFVADGGAFLFSALIGLMAVFFGAFQLMITADLAAKPAAKNKPKKGRK
jgi:thiol:disulfide interchange protein